MFVPNANFYWSTRSVQSNHRSDDVSAADRKTDPWEDRAAVINRMTIIEVILQIGLGRLLQLWMCVWKMYIQ